MIISYDSAILSTNYSIDDYSHCIIERKLKSNSILTITISWSVHDKNLTSNEHRRRNQQKKKKKKIYLGSNDSKCDEIKQ